MRDPDPLVGTWRLVSWENHVGGEVSRPLGDEPVGYLIYGADGHMSVMMMRPGRRSFSSGDLLRAEPDELREAAEGFVAYGGRYELQRDRVIHHVEVSLFPNWVGVDQERMIELDGNRLTLSTRPILLEGRERTARVVWQRV